MSAAYYEWTHRQRDPDRVWMDFACCKGVDPDLMVPDLGASRADINAAKAVCAVCPVAGPCLEYALRNRTAGIWGGTSERERRRLKRERRLRVVA